MADHRTDVLELMDRGELSDEVRRRYAGAARAADASRGEGGCGCGSSPAGTGSAFGASLYGEDERNAAPLEASLGCGNPTAVADLHDGQVVLDLGSGAGGDVLIETHRVHEKAAAAIVRARRPAL